MEKHDYIEMIDGNGKTSKAQGSAHEFMSDLYVACGKAAGVHDDCETESSTETKYDM